MAMCSTTATSEGISVDTARAERDFGFCIRYGSSEFWTSTLCLFVWSDSWFLHIRPLLLLLCAWRSAPNLMGIERFTNSHNKIRDKCPASGHAPPLSPSS